MFVIMVIDVIRYGKVLISLILRLFGDLSVLIIVGI